LVSCAAISVVTIGPLVTVFVMGSIIAVYVMVPSRTVKWCCAGLAASIVGLPALMLSGVIWGTLKALERPKAVPAPAPTPTHRARGNGVIIEAEWVEIR